MVSLRTIYQVCQAGWRARPLEQVTFLAIADSSMTHIAQGAHEVIAQGTYNEPLATQIGVEMGLNPTSDFLYDIANDYVHHLMKKNPKAFKEFLQTHLNEEAVQEYEQT